MYMSWSVCRNEHRPYTGKSVHDIIARPQAKPYPRVLQVHFNLSSTIIGAAKMPGWNHCDTLTTQHSKKLDFYNPPSGRRILSEQPIVMNIVFCGIIMAYGWIRRRNSVFNVLLPYLKAFEPIQYGQGQQRLEGRCESHGSPTPASLSPFTTCRNPPLTFPSPPQNRLRGHR